MFWNTRQKEPELITLLHMEYLSNDGRSVVCLSRDETHDSFPQVWKRPVSRLTEASRLIDVKMKILEILAKDDRVLNERAYMNVAPLHLICSLHSPGQATLVKLLATQRSSDVNVLDALSRTPLHHALSPTNHCYLSKKSEAGSLVDTVACLLLCSANVNAVDCFGLTPLHYLLDYYGTGRSGYKREMIALVRLLVEAGADLDSPLPRTDSPLHSACRLAGPYSVEAVELLLTKDNVNNRDLRTLRTPLQYVFASKVPDTDFAGAYSVAERKVRLLLSHGADVNASDVDGTVPIASALTFMKHSCHLPLLKCLLDNGACTTVQDKDHLQTPLHLVCSYFDKELRELVPLFVKSGGELNVPNSSLYTPFHCSLKHKQCSADTLLYLLEAGADPRLADHAANGSIHMLCESPHQHFKEVVKLLVDRGCNINCSNIRGNTPLFCLLENNLDVEAVRTLIELGADCRATNIEHISPLHMAARSLTFHENVEQIVDVIVRGGGNVNQQDCYGNTPLHYAVRDIKTTTANAVRKLLRAGANPNTKNVLGIAPLHVLCGSGDVPVAEILLDFGADVNLTDAESNAPLHIALAATNNEPQMVRLLLESGADLSVKNCSNVTPLVLMTTGTRGAMMEHTALAIANGKHCLDQRDIEFFELNSYQRVQFSLYLDVAQSIKSFQLGNSTVTLMEFLLSSNMRATRQLVNPQIIDSLRLVVANNDFRQYSYLIGRKLSQVIALKAQLDETAKALGALLSPLVFPECLTEQILRLLNKDDMKALTLAATASTNLEDRLTTDSD